jgi:hypothetical protein
MTTAATPAHDLEGTAAARRARGPQAGRGGRRGNLPAGARLALTSAASAKTAPA